MQQWMWQWDKYLIFLVLFVVFLFFVLLFFFVLYCQYFLLALLASVIRCLLTHACFCFFAFVSANNCSTWIRVLLKAVVMYFQAHQSNRVCNALALLQCVASHPETRSAFLQGMHQFCSWPHHFHHLSDLKTWYSKSKATNPRSFPYSQICFNQFLIDSLIFEHHLQVAATTRMDYRLILSLFNSQLIQQITPLKVTVCVMKILTVLACLSNPNHSLTIPRRFKDFNT